MGGSEIPDALDHVITSANISSPWTHASFAAAWAVIATVSLGCTVSQEDPQWPSLSHGGPAADTALFSAAVGTMFKWTARGSTFHVDPRPLRADPEIEYPSPGALAVVAPEVARQRSLVLQRLGIEEADAVGERCMGQGGGLPVPPPPGRASPPPPPSQIEAERDRCRARGDFKTVIFGLPRPGGAHFPPRTIDERSRGLEQGYRTVRRVSISPSGYAVYDLVFAPAPGGQGWVLVEEKVLGGIGS